MPSTALGNLKNRLADIDQLLAAHTALTKLKKAEAAAKGGGLAKIIDVVNALVNEPGVGRPAEVAALNRAAFVLLTAHFQGFVDELHREAADHVLKGKVSSIDDVVKMVKPRNANPHVDVIEKMFSGLGCYEVMSSISWNKCSNVTVKKRLTDYIETRNKIAHGKQLVIKKYQVIAYKEYVERLAEKLASTVSTKVKASLGKAPW
uniref:HEPN domain-containing protein n=1 Tax=Hylemonella sp. TaxID=2066020 RepID=UPI0035AF8244